MSYSNKTRITAEDSTITAIVKLAEGNPGALRVLSELYQNGHVIDPASALGGLGPILSLDSYNIYGSEIWMLYKDLAKENLSATIGLLRATQLGFLSPSALKEAINTYNQMTPDMVAGFIEQVCKRLPDFKYQP